MTRFIDLSAAEKALVNADKAASGGNQKAAEEARILAQVIKSEREKRSGVAPVQSDFSGRPMSFQEVQPPVDGLDSAWQRVKGAAMITGQKMTSFDDNRLMETIEKSYPGAQFEMDTDGNVIVDFTQLGGGRGYLNPPGFDGQDAQQMALTAAQFGPAGKIAAGAGSAAGRFLGRAGQVGTEAAAGAGLAATTEVLRDLGSQAFDGTDEMSLSNIDQGNVGITGAFGAAAPFIASAAGAVLRRAFPGLSKQGVQVINEDGTITEEAVQALQKAGTAPAQVDELLRKELQQSGVLTAEQAERFNMFQQATGVKPTRAQVTQTADDFQAQQEAAKTSGPVRTLLDQQDEALAGRVGQMADEAGGTSVSPDDTGQQVFGAVTKVFDDADANIGNLYGAAREAAGDAPIATMRNLAQVVQRYRGEDTLSSGTVSAVRGEMARLGILNKNGSLAGKETIGASGNRSFVAKKISPSQAESLRQYLNKLYEGANGRGRTLIHEMKQALDEDVFSAVGGDIYGQARQAARARNELLELTKRSRYDKNTQSAIENILEGKVRSEGTLESLVLNKAADVRNLRAVKDFLNKQGGDNGVQAWNSMRTDTINYLLKEATKGAKTETGGAVFSGKSFGNAINKLGMDKLRVLFDGKELAQIMRLKNAADLRTPVAGTALGQGPSAQMISGILDNIPGINGVRAMYGAFTQRSAVDPVRETVAAFNRAFSSGSGAQRAQGAQAAKEISGQ